MFGLPGERGRALGDRAEPAGLGRGGVGLGAYATAPTDNEIKVPYHQPVIVPYGRQGQEIVPFDGTIHGLFHFSISAGGKLHVRAQTNLPYTYTYVHNFHVESAGATGNIIAHETLKLYFDENGVPTMEAVNFVAECKNFAS